MLENVTKRRDDLIRKLRKWSSKNNMVFCKFFNSELQKLIENKNYSLDGINFLWGIYNKHHNEIKKELKNDKTDFSKNLKSNLLKKYGFEFRKSNNNALFEEKVVRLHNYLFT